jgi:hypothetical protein
MSWVLMTAVGLGCLWMMRHSHDKADFILVRCAAAAFVGAGTIGATGWLGRLFNGVVDGVIEFADARGSEAFGENVVWVIAGAVGVAWIGALLPERFFSFEYPDWLVVFGFVLPILLASVPGDFGEFLRTVILGAGGLMNGEVDGRV